MSKQKHIAIKASKKSISSMILSILMLLSVIPLHSSTIFAESTKKTVMNGTGTISKNDSIWFGIRGKDLTDAGSEIQWRVLDTNTNIGEDRLFLLSEKLIGKAPYHNPSFPTPPSRKWQGSDAQKWCKDFSGENGNEDFKSLTAQELAAIKPTTESNPKTIAPKAAIYPERYVLNGDKVFFLSTGEAEKYFQPDNERIATDGNNPEKWWLRSPHRTRFQRVGIVKEDGGIDTANVTSKLATRPAFNLDKEKVLFTSPAVGGKQSNGVGKDALKGVEDTDTTEWKLTLKDDSRKEFKLDTDGGKKVERQDSVLTIPYKNATTGANEYISAIVEKNGSITYYGRLKAVENSNTDKNGEVTVQLPDNFDKLYLINEQLNGDKKTDYSSAKIEVEIPAQQPPQPTEYTVTMENDGNGKSMANPTKAKQGDIISINAEANKGFKFKKWQALKGVPGTSGQVHFDEGAENTAFIMPESDVTIKAIFGKLYKIDVKSNNSQYGTAKATVDGVVGDIEEEIAGTKITLKATPNSGSGYTFDKWEVVSGNIQLTDASSANTTFTMPDNDVEIKAYFKGQQPPQPTKYKIKLTDDGNGTAKSMVGGVQVTEAEQGKKVTITAMPDRGYKFDEWRVLSGGIRLRDEDSATTTFTMPNRDVEIKAYFKKKSSGGSSHDTEYYNITTKTDKHGTVEARSRAREGTEVSVTVDPDKGYKLDEITVTDKRGRDITIKETNRENRYKFTMPARDVTVEATFKQIKQEQPSKPTTPPTIPPTNNNKPIENNIIKKQQTTVFTIGSNIMTVITDGKATQTTIDAKPFLSQGRVMIPVRYAAESLGMQVEWNKQTQTVVLKDRENTVMIPIKTNKIIVGNQEYTSDVTPILKNGRTYLTISNIAKALRMRAGQDVKWDNKIKQVTIIKEVEVR